MQSMRGKTTDKGFETRWRKRKGCVCYGVGGCLHFWDNEKFIAPSPAASTNQRRICIADGPCRNKINLCLISRRVLKISPSHIYICVICWHPESEVTTTLQGAIVSLHPFKGANSHRSHLKEGDHDISMQSLLRRTSWKISCSYALKAQSLHLCSCLPPQLFESRLPFFLEKRSGHFSIKIYILLVIFRSMHHKI